MAESISYHRVPNLCAFCHKLEHKEAECREKVHIQSQRSAPQSATNGQISRLPRAEYRRKPLISQSAPQLTTFNAFEALTESPNYVLDNGNAAANDKQITGMEESLTQPPDKVPDVSGACKSPEPLAVILSAGATHAQADERSQVSDSEASLSNKAPPTSPTAGSVLNDCTNLPPTQSEMSSVQPASNMEERLSATSIVQSHPTRGTEALDGLLQAKRAQSVPRSELGDLSASDMSRAENILMPLAVQPAQYLDQVPSQQRQPDIPLAVQPAQHLAQAPSQQRQPDIPILPVM